MQVTAHPPIDEAFRLVHEVEQRPGMLSVTLATGFPWADVPDMVDDHRRRARVEVIADQHRAAVAPDRAGGFLAAAQRGAASPR